MYYRYTEAVWSQRKVHMSRIPNTIDCRSGVREKSIHVSYTLVMDDIVTTIKQATSPIRLKKNHYHDKLAYVTIHLSDRIILRHDTIFFNHNHDKLVYVTTHFSDNCPAKLAYVTIRFSNHSHDKFTRVTTHFHDKCPT